jgi:GTP-binding protein Era
MGIVNGENHQIVFSDTPGVLNPHYKLHESMMRFVSSALQDADIILFVTDIFETKMNHEETLERIKNHSSPVLVLMNKIDLAKDPADLEGKVNYWKEQIPRAEILPISALHGLSIDFIMPRLIELLPEGEAFFPKDELTDKPMRFFISEIVREKILQNYSKEIPYSCEVVVESYKDKENIVDIRVLIYVNRDSQKAILIGHKGSKMKKVGIESRIDIEAFIDKKVFLDLYVKVDKDWRDKEQKLKKYGYE